ncbi:hypothetical protein E4U24_000561 [Claviceps purpurea]|nr:hypothetical protein E4U51_002924 [Claviceps purpurea]KAG6184171.1 hypothetical protein E4U27_001048 [Claviceps purpurea]KAG6187318.1 hypothetical protein E4U10_005517 [Claviceps purpurea]KAG6189652.1 hypothetical protein E4U36_004675 [Claviceps purpurea]KAG6224215.1 hypothetical protein E4U34_000473 [Claviceps purpurea]
MASPPPVAPSRAALNALRGLLLTTSCSLILLSEERRRRMQIALTAIENAKKLQLVAHSFRESRRTIARTSGSASGSEGDLFAEIDDDALSEMSITRAKRSSRRRGRTHIRGGIDEATDICEYSSRLLQPISRNKSHHERIQPAEIAEPVGPMSRATHFTGNLDILSFNKMKSTWLRSNRPQRSVWKAPRRGTRFHSTHAAHLPVSDTNITEARERSIPTTDHSSLASRHHFRQLTADLERLLTDLEARIAENKEKICDKDLSSAKDLVEEIASFGHLPVAAMDLVQSQAIRLFRIATHSPADIIATLSSLLPLKGDAMEILAPCALVLKNSAHRKSLREVLIFLSNNNSLCPWTSGRLIHRLLSWLSESQCDFVSIKQLYLGLQKSGLFRDIEIRKEVEIEIRQLMVELALKADETDFTNTELRMLEEDLGAVVSDVRLLRDLIPWKVNGGKWDEVWSHIQVLRQSIEHPEEEAQSLGNKSLYQEILSDATDNFVAQCRDHDEVEAFLRKAVTGFSLQRIRPKWFFAVLDGHARRRRADSAGSWLHFCCDHKLLVGVWFNRLFFARCRKSLWFCDRSIRRLYDRLLAKRLRMAQDLATTQPADPDHLETPPAVALRNTVSEQLESENVDTERARHLISSAYRKGRDVSRALTPLLIALFQQGEDPSSWINTSLESGIRLQDSIYNAAAQALSARGKHSAAIKVCEIAARENGNGQLSYNEYNFANLVFAYSGFFLYKELQSLLSEFTSEMIWWHGSKICKETIKLAMKKAASRISTQPEQSEIHRQAFEQLQVALEHVKQCRPSSRQRVDISKTLITILEVKRPKTTDSKREKESHIP